MKIEGTILFTEIGPSIFIFIGHMPVKRANLFRELVHCGK